MNVFFEEHPLPEYSFNLVKAFSGTKTTVKLLTWHPKRARKEIKINPVVFPLSKVNWALSSFDSKNIFMNYCFYPWFCKLVNTDNINLLHVNLASRSEVYLKAKKSLKLPLVYTNHYVPEPEPLESFSADHKFNNSEKYWIKRVCDGASKVVTVSEFAKNRLKEQFGIDSTVVYHGVNLNKYNTSLPRDKTNLGFKSDEKIVLWVARFGHHPYKDPFTFINAIPLVLRQCPKTRFVMIGTGFLKPYVLRMAKKLSIMKNLTIINRVDSLNLFYAASDVFVLTSFNDNFGLVAAEAMACGTSAIVSNHGAPQEFVKGAGLIFEYGSHYDLSEKIVDLIQNDSLRQNLGLKAHNRIKQRFTWDKAMQKYASIYENLV